jgi:hypothetical protein
MTLETLDMSHDLDALGTCSCSQGHPILLFDLSKRKDIGDPILVELLWAISTHIPHPICCCHSCIAIDMHACGDLPNVCQQPGVLHNINH